MKKNIILFICFFYILSISSVYAKNTKTNNKLLPKGTKANSRKLSDKIDLAQRGVLRRKISQAVDSHVIRKNISGHLEAISKICDEETEQPFDKKIEDLENLLQKLRRVIHQYLREPYLTEEDAIYLRSIEYNTTRETLSFAQPLTEELVRKMKLDLGETFLMAYYLYYGFNNEVDDDDVYPENIKDVKHEWARKIYKGLSCVKIENSE